MKSPGNSAGKGKPKFLILLLAGSLFLFSCNKKESNENNNQQSTSNTATSAKAPQDSKNITVASDAEKIENGRKIFMANCIVCHNRNPEKDGAVGPAIKGSSFELIKARVQNQGYPPGYKPKRPTKVMPKLPLTEEQISYVAAFLK
jgi:mono/diheme cytochrome c family protein